MKKLNLEKMVVAKGYIFSLEEGQTLNDIKKYVAFMMEGEQIWRIKVNPNNKSRVLVFFK